MNFGENHGKLRTVRSTSAIRKSNPAPPVYQFWVQNRSATGRAYISGGRTYIDHGITTQNLSSSDILKRLIFNDCWKTGCDIPIKLPIKYLIKLRGEIYFQLCIIIYGGCFSCESSVTRNKSEISDDIMLWGKKWTFFSLFGQAFDRQTYGMFLSIFKVSFKINQV